MRRTHDWHGTRRLFGWIGAASGFVLLRWTLLRGTYRVSLEDQRVLREGGFWPAEFAQWMTVGVAVIMIAVLAAQIISWLAGRKRRAAVRLSTPDVHRDILM